MEHVWYYGAKGIVLAGMLLLGLSFVPISHITKQLPKGTVRTRWLILAGMTAVFFVGLSVLFFRIHCLSPYEAFIPCTFFVGTCFVLLVTSTARQTTFDVKNDTAFDKENITDSLTGLYNRRYLDSRIATEMARVQRYGLEISVLMIGIDSLKTVIDSLGCGAGEAVLRNISALIRNVSRNADIIARYSDEEIVLVAPSTPLQESEILAERLCRHIDFSLLLNVSETGGKPVPHITVSIGVASVNHNTADADALVAAAKAALNQAKHEGCNRVVIAKA
jgi:diguanylate cyclase (GGDEF)-like protein